MSFELLLSGPFFYWLRDSLMKFKVMKSSKFELEVLESPKLLGFSESSEVQTSGGEQKNNGQQRRYCAGHGTRPEERADCGGPGGGRSRRLGPPDAAGALARAANNNTGY